MVAGASRHVRCHHAARDLGVLIEFAQLRRPDFVIRADLRAQCAHRFPELLLPRDGGGATSNRPSRSWQRHDGRRWLLALWWSTNLNVLAVAATVVPVAVTFVFSVWFSRRPCGGAHCCGRTVDAAAPLTPLHHLEFWRDVFPIGAGMLFSALYFRIDVFLIEHWRGPEAVATYNAAFRLLEGVRLLPGAVMAVMLPSLQVRPQTRSRRCDACPLFSRSLAA